MEKGEEGAGTLSLSLPNRYILGAVGKGKGSAQASNRLSIPHGRQEYERK